MLYTAFLVYPVTLLTLAALLLTALRKKARRTIDLAFQSLLISLLGWVGFNAIQLYDAYGRGQPSDLMGALGGASVLATVVCFYIFCELFPNRTMSRGLRARAYAITAISVLMLPVFFSDLWIGNRRFESGRMFVTHGPLFFYVTGWSVLVALFGVAALVRNGRRTKDIIAKRQLRLLRNGALATLAIVVPFSIALPYLGYQQYQFIGTNACLLLIAGLIQSILEDRLFDLRTGLLRWSLIVLASFVLGVSAYLGLWQMGILLELEGVVFSWFNAVMMGAFFLGAALVARMGFPIIERFFLGQSISAEKILLQLFQKQDMEAENRALDSLLEDILETFRSHFRCRDALIFVVDRNGQVRVARSGPMPAFLESKRARRLLSLHRRQPLPEKMVEPLRAVRLASLREATGESDLSGLRDRSARVSSQLEQMLLESKAAGYQAFLPLVAHRRIAGYLILGQKGNDTPYYDKDMVLLDALSFSVALLLGNQLYHEEVKASMAESQQEVQALAESIASTRKAMTEDLGDRNLVYTSENMERTVQKLREASSMDRPVLVTGETGTGKELLARLIHKERYGTKAPFVAVNSAAIAPGLWESEIFGHVKGAFTDARQDRAGKVAEAANGTLFLDEIGDTPLEMQARLLRLLQERRFSPVGSEKELEARCSFVFATHRDLEEMTKTARFREDLYYRISVFRVEVSPLRQRREDIPNLLRYFLDTLSLELGINRPQTEPGVLPVLLRYRWPGNIRELENVTIRALATMAAEQKQTGQPEMMLALRHFPEQIIGPTGGNYHRTDRTNTAGPPTSSADAGEPELNGNYEDLLAQQSRRLIVRALEQTGGNRARAAELLGIKRGRLLYQIQALGIDNNGGQH